MRQLGGERKRRWMKGYLCILGCRSTPDVERMLQTKRAEWADQFKHRRQARLSAFSACQWSEPFFAVLLMLVRLLWW